MILQRVNRADAEKVFIVLHNTTGAAVSAGYLVCFNVTLAASAKGTDIQKPLTSALQAFAGVAQADIADDGYGRVQVYGYNTQVYFSFTATQTYAYGQVFGPGTAIWWALSSGASHQLGPIVLCSERSTTGTAALVQLPVLIRGL